MEFILLFFGALIISPLILAGYIEYLEHKERITKIENQENCCDRKEEN